MPLPCCSWALPLHLLMAGSLLRHNREACATAALSSPAARQLSSSLFQTLSELRYTLLPPKPPPLDALAECSALLSFTHLTLGLLLPAVASAAVEARLFQRHQAQRQQLGLPDERGWQAWLCLAVAGALELDVLARALAAWMLLGQAFDVATLTAGGPTPFLASAATGPH